MQRGSSAADHKGIQLIKWIKGHSELEHQQETKMKVLLLGKDFTCFSFGELIKD
jgi:hypothetical protein